MTELPKLECHKVVQADRIVSWWMDDYVESLIEREHYFVGGDGLYGAKNKDPELDRQPLAFGEGVDLITFCILELKNGATVTGESRVIDPSLNVPELGRAAARRKAIDKVCELEGYRLRVEFCKK